jgi:hypothetical protein
MKRRKLELAFAAPQDVGRFFLKGCVKVLNLSLRATEGSEAISILQCEIRDRFVALLLAMTSSVFFSSLSI